MAKTWQVVLATVAIFVAGLVTGGRDGLRRRPLDGPPPAPRPRDEWRPSPCAPATPRSSSSVPQLMRSFVNQLDLTDEQRAGSADRDAAPPRSSRRERREVAAHRPRWRSRRCRTRSRPSPHPRAADQVRGADRRAAGAPRAVQADARPAGPARRSRRLPRRRRIQGRRQRNRCCARAGRGMLRLGQAPCMGRRANPARAGRQQRYRRPTSAVECLATSSFPTFPCPITGYQVIARKWRPQTFADVVGQDHVVRTLKNAIARGRIAHAYLFVGPRGTGKTSIARIFAKALNCTGGPNADFDPEDPAVVAIAEGSHLDVIEIDGASNNGVDQVRDLRDNAQLRPGAGQIQDLHHRRGAHALGAGLQRAPEDPRGAAAPREVHLRDDRGAEGAPDHPLPLPALRPQADPARPDRRAPDGRSRRPRRSRWTRAALACIARLADGGHARRPVDLRPDDRLLRRARSRRPTSSTSTASSPRRRSPSWPARSPPATTAGSSRSSTSATRRAATWCAC